MAEVSITEMLPMTGSGDTRLRLPTGDVFHLPAGTDQTLLVSCCPRGGRLGTGLSRPEMVGWCGVIVLAVMFILIAAGFRLSIAPVGDAMARMMPRQLVERASGMVLAQLDLTLTAICRHPTSNGSRPSFSAWWR